MIEWFVNPGTFACVKPVAYQDGLHERDGAAVRVGDAVRARTATLPGEHLVQEHADNLARQFPFENAFLVGTGIEVSFGEIDAVKVSAIESAIQSCC